MNGAAEMPGVEWKTLDGSLLLITPKEATPEVETPHGLVSAVRADIAVLDGPRAEEVLRNLLILPQLLQSQIRPTVDSGGMVLGRLIRMQARKGIAALWGLSSASENDKRMGRQWLARSCEPPFDSPGS